MFSGDWRRIRSECDLGGKKQDETLKRNDHSWRRGIKNQFRELTISDISLLTTVILMNDRNDGECNGFF
jgi:hypothetical protein